MDRYLLWLILLYMTYSNAFPSEDLIFFEWESNLNVRGQRSYIIQYYFQRSICA